MTQRQVIASSLASEIDRAAGSVEARVVAWRRDLHEHPELGNREFRTAKIVQAHLEALGLDEVRTGVAHTGVVGLLKGALQQGQSRPLPAPEPWQCSKSGTARCPPTGP